MTTIVVGGGLSGLVRAYALTRRGEEVRLLEASPRPGGAVRTESSEGFLLELGPNTVRPTPEIWGLVEELGLVPSALLANPRLPRFVDFQGRLHAFGASPLDLVTTGLLSVSGKLRLLREPFVRPNGPPRESVAEFFSRRLGPEVAERLVAPFIAGIWAGDASRLSVAAAFPQVARWEREHGSLLRGALAAKKSRPARPAPRGLLSFREGLETLPRALAGHLGARVRLGSVVRAIRRRGNGWRVETQADALDADRLVVAVSTDEASRLLAPLAPEAARALSEIDQPPLAVLHLGWDASAFPAAPRGFGHLVVPAPGRRILGAVWSSSLFPGRSPEGEILVTGFAGGSRDPSAIELPDAELTEIARRELSASLGTRELPRVIRVTRYRRALPQYDREHQARMAALDAAEAALPGLELLGNYRGGISVGDVTRNALSLPA